jgi:hypothetical protein
MQEEATPAYSQALSLYLLYTFYLLRKAISVRRDLHRIRTGYLPNVIQNAKTHYHCHTYTKPLYDYRIFEMRYFKP